MKTITYILSFIPAIVMAQEDFSFPLYFEDAVGNRDTLIVGYDINATSGIDNIFGEVNTISVPWSENFEVRITDKMPSILYGETENETFRTKKQIIKKYCGEAWSYWDNIYIDIKNLQFPITISYINGIFQNQCVIGTVLQNYEENAWFDAGFFDGYLSHHSMSIQYNESHLTYQDEDGATIYSFWLKIGDNSLLTLNNKELKKPYNGSVFPNPIEAGGILYIGYAANYTITDVHGKILQAGKTEENSIQLNHYEQGIYMLTIESNGKIYQQKISIF